MLVTLAKWLLGKSISRLIRKWKLVLFIGHENEEIRQTGAVQAPFLEDAEIAQFRR